MYRDLIVHGYIQYFLYLTDGTQELQDPLSLFYGGLHGGPALDGGLPQPLHRPDPHGDLQTVCPDPQCGPPPPPQQTAAGDRCPLLCTQRSQYFVHTF